MKIFFAIKNLSSSVGGAERVLCEIASILVNRGHQITIITFDSIGSNSFYFLDSKIRRINLSIGDSSSRTKLFESFLRLKALKKVITKEKPSIVIGFMHSMYILLAFALIGVSIPVIASEHIVIDHYRKKPFQFILLILSSFLVNQFTVLSSSIKSKYPHLIRRKMTVIPNPVKNIKFKKFTKKTFDRKILLNIGRLENQKDHSTLIKAFSMIAGSFPQWDLKIVGDGSLRNKLKKEINALNLNKRIFLKGFTKQIDCEYAQADIFVISSFYESFGLVTAEAMSCGIPCVGFADCPGTNELIVHEKTGLLVDSTGGRSASLASALTRIISDENFRKILGKNGEKFIKTEFSDKEVTDSWEHLLYNVVRK